MHSGKGIKDQQGRLLRFVLQLSLFNLKLLESSGLLDSQPSTSAGAGPSASAGSSSSGTSTTASAAIPDSESQHFLRNGSKGFYHCLHCEYKTLCRSHMIDHVRTHTGARPYKCYVCGRCFTQKSPLNVHLRRGYTCLDRNDNLLSLNTTVVLQRRLITVVSAGDLCLSIPLTLDPAHLPVLESDFSEMLFRRGPNQKFACDLCDFTTDYKQSMSRHVKIHTGEKPFSCERCGRQFRHKNSLGYHKSSQNCVPPEDPASEPTSLPLCGHSVGLMFFPQLEAAAAHPQPANAGSHPLNHLSGISMTPVIVVTSSANCPPSVSSVVSCSSSSSCASPLVQSFSAPSAVVTPVAVAGLSAEHVELTSNPLAQTHHSVTVPPSQSSTPTPSSHHHHHPPATATHSGSCASGVVPSGHAHGVAVCKGHPVSSVQPHPTCVAANGSMTSDYPLAIDDLFGDCDIMNNGDGNNGSGGGTAKASKGAGDNICTGHSCARGHHLSGDSANSCSSLSAAATLHYTKTVDGCFSCNYCAYISPRKHNVEGHVRTHTGERPYLCRQCGKRFRHSSAFSVHRNTVCVPKKTRLLHLNAAHHVHHNPNHIHHQHHHQHSQQPQHQQEQQQQQQQQQAQQQSQHHEAHQHQLQQQSQQQQQQQQLSGPAGLQESRM
ncbi:zinc finger protein 628-like [Varroa jacobsoni]|uniref:zinc finger protein 628-like n=1 Tax=Varroa jacobsoni TaxID=62625 RepID=UPI000BF9C95D|nr:zinc finger protein 628-like [Varroa jacobsoni]